MKRGPAGRSRWTVGEVQRLRFSEDSCCGWYHLVKIPTRIEFLSGPLPHNPPAVGTLLFPPALVKASGSTNKLEAGLLETSWNAEEMLLKKLGSPHSLRLALETHSFIVTSTNLMNLSSPKQL